LKESNTVNNIPLFLSVDEEGGSISRLPNGFKKIPVSGKIGSINNSAISFQVGNIIGEALQLLGFNMDFAPVLDINSNPQNPVIGDRAFGSEAELVSKLGIQTMKGLQAKNIISVVKHFPGHGDTSVDSHLGLPIVNHDLERLKNFELRPFMEAINNDVDAIMIAHLLLPQIDPDNPATLSPAVITTLLRKEMQFDGVVITDDLTMGAIADNYDLGEAAVKSINAGSDIILVCHEYAHEENVLKTLQKAAANGDIAEERINESVYRILKLKQKYNLSDQTDFVTQEEMNARITAINQRIMKLLGE
jgi:beta-N-acetylhexosaminidase